jgi:Zn-dependent peptidase ImmA (M78 family)
MIYEVINQPKKIETALLDRAVSFASRYLSIDIDLTIQFETLKNYQYGFCDYDEDEVIITIAKRLSPKDMVRTLFHELVHVQQYSEGRLQHEKIYFKNAEVTYKDYPWEIEAFEAEQKMMDAFELSINS